MTQIAVNNVVSQLEQSKCSGCRSCEYSCPQHCIALNENEEGFLYPQIDSPRCTQCGICVKHCPQLIETITPGTHLDPVQAYTMNLKDKTQLAKSSSGGFFAGLATFVLNQKGVVFGCAFDKQFRVYHTFIESMADLSTLQGSKYVASDLKDVYPQVKQFLRAGRLVLFSGSPCHVAGLKAYLGCPFENLITADVICHGTPSPKLFRKYLEWQGHRLGGRIERFRFRDKTRVAWGLGGSIGTYKKEQILNPYCDPYYATFLRGETYRLSCYQCKYANPNREGDFTMGDYWGIKKNASSCFCPQGNSIVFVNTSQAQTILPQLESFFNMDSVSFEHAVTDNENFLVPMSYPPVRDAIYQNLNSMSFDLLQKKNLLHENLILWHFRRWRRKLMPRVFRHWMNHFLRRS